ncbi:proline dehydrogenase family protein [Kurthia senegalensis]|uniref:proline dehydrogenase family protein n=1 Tax=Kurthia senegalensis TaxID=1033740 RepID=UPI00028948CE|nr:proline dehydrogenase family protein [Kurthia senegalensis]
MADVLKNVFLSLSNNRTLNRAAQNYGLQLGAKLVVAGTNIEETMETIRQLNSRGIEATVDHLGEFVYEREEAIAAKMKILDVLDAIHESGVKAHISIKPSQVGLDIDYDFCLENVLEIAEKAAQYGIFINLDQENYERLHATFAILETIEQRYPNTAGTVIQAYLHEAPQLLEKYSGYRLRIVKGAYKESEQVALTSKAAIDEQFVALLEAHLLNGKFTSVATHDHEIIQHIQKFVAMHNIPADKFEFQMLYGFRTDMQQQLAKDGYQFTTYVPFGADWYGYFMRRLAERPQNIQLVTKQVFTKKTNTVIGVAAAAFILGRLTKK